MLAYCKHLGCAYTQPSVPIICHNQPYAIAGLPSGHNAGLRPGEYAKHSISSVIAEDIVLAQGYPL